MYGYFLGIFLFKFIIIIHLFYIAGSMVTKTMSREAAQKDGGFKLLTNLEPNTTYIVSIVISTNYGKGIHSDPLLFTTLGLGGDWYLRQEYHTSVQQIMKHNFYP